MPNKTIYVSEEDLHLFDRAQQLAGGNLSAAVARGLERFVRTEGDRAEGFQEVTVRVGAGRAVRVQRFSGELLGEWRHPNGTGSVEIFQVFRTPKGCFALYVRRVPDWSAWVDREMWRRVWSESGIGSPLGDDRPDPREWGRDFKEDLRQWRRDLKEEARGMKRASKNRWSQGSCWPGPSEATLDVASSLAALADKVPPEFYDTLVAAAEHPTVEDLDI